MKNHLKRIAAPKTWHIDRKKNVFIIRPNPGSHSLGRGLPLGIILRDQLKLAKTMSEVRRLLNNNEVLIDGKRKKDHRLIVGLFDVISIPLLKKTYKVELDNKGRLTIIELLEEQGASKICKVIGKTLLKKGLIQIGLHDGKTLITKKEILVGDSLVVELPSLKITSVFNLKNGAKVLLTAGKHSGVTGIVEQMAVNKIICQTAKEQIETAKEHLFVVG